MAGEGNRPLLPAPSTSPMRPLSSSSQQAAKKENPTRTSTACEACKRRKSRCVGRPPPCQMCLTCGTECVIDATLDQRRKLSTKRLAEQADGQRELLSSLFQTLQHSAPEDLQNLVHSIRSGASAEQVAACIRTNVKSLQDQEIPSSSNVDDLLDSFGALLRDRDSNSSGQSVSSSPSKRSLSVSTHMTSQFPPIYSPSNQYEHSALSPNPDSPRVALHQTHQRWDRYVQTQHAQLDTIGLDNLDGFDRIGINSADLNGTLQTPPLGDQMPLGSTEEDTADGQHSSPFSTPFNSASAADERFFWHPVLRVIPTPSGPSPLAPNMSIHTATDSRHRSTTSLDERYVEIIQPFPSSLTDLKNDAALDKTPSHLNSTKYPIHTIQPRYKSENSPLARHIIDFRDAARRFIAEGNPLSEVLGRDDGVAVDLFLRDRTENDGFTVSNWACEIYCPLSEHDLFVRLALTSFTVHLMRWLILPTPQNYSAIPAMLRPLPSQLLVPHHPAVDFLPLPALRDALVKNLRDWITTFAGPGGWTVDWNGGIEGAVEDDGEIGQGRLRLRREFEDWVSRPGNWAVGRSVLGVFPELEGAEGVHLVEGR